MSSLEQFEIELQEALNNLYNPGYQPTAMVSSVLRCSPREGIKPIRAAVAQAIEEFRPPPSVSASAHGRRIYGVLFHRYVEGLNQDEAAERLNISPRHLRREQRQAVHILARYLWQRATARPPAAGGGSMNEVAPPSATVATAGLVEWRSQVRQELESLRKSAPGTVADVSEALRTVADLVRPLAARYDVSLRIAHTEPDLVVAMHPSTLRQLIVEAITELVQRMSSGEIELSAERQAEHIGIIVTASPLASDGVPEDYLIEDLLGAQGGIVQWRLDGDALSLHVGLPPADWVDVVIVDDNEDLVRIYERYLDGTRYRLSPIMEGDRILERIQELAPDIIVVDIMLPDIDGWELLAYLHNHPATKSVPVIVCSVIRQEELSLSLGAILHLPKPVRKREFIQALDQALAHAAAATPTEPVSSEPAG